MFTSVTLERRIYIKYVSTIIKEGNKILNLADSGEISNFELQLMMMDVGLIIASRDISIKQLNYLLQTIRDDEKRTFIQATIENHNKEKQQLEKFYSSALKRFKEPK